MHQSVGGSEVAVGYNVRIQVKSANMYANLDKVVASLGAKLGGKSDSSSAESEKGTDQFLFGLSLNQFMRVVVSSSSRLRLVFVFVSSSSRRLFISSHRRLIFETSHRRDVSSSSDSRLSSCS